MSKEVSREEIEENFNHDVPKWLAAKTHIEVGKTFLLEPEESKQVNHLLDEHMKPNIFYKLHHLKYLGYISKLSDIPADSIDYTCVFSNILTVVPLPEKKKKN